MVLGTIGLMGTNSFASRRAQVANLEEAQECMRKQVPSANASSLKSQYGINTDGSSAAFVDQGIATAAERLKDLGRPAFMNGMTIELFPGGRGAKCSSFTPGKKHVQIVTSCARSDGSIRNSNATSISLNVLHEVGHAVGQGNMYKSYQGSVSKCAISPYCTNNDNDNPRNEEFAEVFAAFVHAPSTLKSRCPDAYDFMAKNVFGTQGTKNICNGIPSSSMAAENAPNPMPVGSGGGSSNDLGTGTQVASLGGDLSPILALAMGMMQKNEEPEKDQPAVLVIPRSPAAIQQTHPGAR